MKFGLIELRLFLSEGLKTIFLFFFSFFLFFFFLVGVGEINHCSFGGVLNFCAKRRQVLSYTILSSPLYETGYMSYIFCGGDSSYGTLT